MIPYEVGQINIYLISPPQARHQRTKASPAEEIKKKINEIYAPSCTNEGGAAESKKKKFLVNTVINNRMLQNKSR